MLIRLLSSLSVIIGIACLSGCGAGKLNENKTLILNGEFSAKSIDLPSQSKPQTLYVEFTSKGGEVSVYIFKEEDAKGEDGLANARATKALAKKIDSKGDTLSADIPENTPSRVIVRSGGRDAEVNLKISNQKP